MDEARARDLLAEIARRTDGQVLLLRGAEFLGSDIDVLALPRGEARLAGMLRSAGLHPRSGDPGHTLWEDRTAGVVIDALRACEWPAYYPDLEGILARLEVGHGLPPFVSPEDRLLMMGADAIQGRSLEKIQNRARPLLANGGMARRLTQVATEQGFSELADLVGALGSGDVRAVRGRLSYPAAIALALRSRPARAALVARLARRFRRPGLPSRVEPRSQRRGFLIAISGPDGAGKSSSAETVRGLLENAGLPAEVTWDRLGQGQRILKPLGRTVKRILRRQGTIADPVAAGGPSVSERQDPSVAKGRRGPLSWAWVVLVAAGTAISWRRAARPRRTGTTVVCDRWLVDGLVDMKVRYGRHRVAERVLRVAVPTPDLAILLELDPDEAARRKPGDQAGYVLAGMASLYAGAPEAHSMVPIDAGAPLAEVQRDIAAVVDAFLARRGVAVASRPVAA